MVLFRILLAVLLLCVVADAQLKPYFYKGTKCSDVEEKVRSVVVKAIQNNPGIAAGLLRLHFHDCFVNGCDGSVLIDSTTNNTAEKDHPANNPSLRGFEVIQAAKLALGANCRELVSCADIVALAARDSVAFQGGPFWNIKTGRRDARISRASDVPRNLPPPFLNLQQLLQSFAAKNLGLEDLVALSGGHTIGRSHCSSFSNRLFSFSSNSPQDPSLDKTLASTLKSQCPNTATSGNNTVLMGKTPATFDKDYYVEVRNGRGLFTSDAALVTNKTVAKLVHSFASHQKKFFDQFVISMIKMSEIQVQTGNQGEIRKVCNIIN